MIIKSQIAEFAKQKKIDEVTILREYIQVVFLSVLYSEKESEKIFFKGGTAAHLLLGVPRFSQDLDFTAVLPQDKILILLKTALGQANKTIVPNLYFANGKKRFDASFTKRLIFTDRHLKQNLAVGLDFSLREIPLTEKSSVVLTDFPITFTPVVRHLDWPEILAEKIRAVMIRCRGRDLYDLLYLLAKDVPVNWDLINQKMKLYDRTINASDLREKISKFPQKKLEQDLGKFLSADERNQVPPRLKELLLEQLENRGIV